MEQETSRGYNIIEPPIHKALGWDKDLIVACLEVIRLELPNYFPHFPDSIKYFLLPLHNPHGSPYPVIGAYSPNHDEAQQLPGFQELYDIVEKWVNEWGIDNIRREAEKIKILSWQQLKSIGHHPNY